MISLALFCSCCGAFLLALFCKLLGLVMGPMVGCPVFELVEFSFTEKPSGLGLEQWSVGLVPGLMVGSAV